MAHTPTTITVTAQVTVPDRDTIAQAIYTAVVGVNYKPWKGHSEDRWNNALEAADAVLAVLADQPTVAEAKVQAFNEAADEIEGQAYPYGTRYVGRRLARHLRSRAAQPTAATP